MSTPLHFGTLISPRISFTGYFHMSETQKARKSVKIEPKQKSHCTKHVIGSLFHPNRPVWVYKVGEIHGAPTMQSDMLAIRCSVTIVETHATIVLAHPVQYINPMYGIRPVREASRPMPTTAQRVQHCVD